MIALSAQTLGASGTTDSTENLGSRLQSSLRIDQGAGTGKSAGDIVEISEEAKRLLAGASESGESSDASGDAVRQVGAGAVSQSGGETKSAQEELIENLTEKLEEAKEKLEKAQEKLSKAMTKLSAAEDDGEKFKAQAEVEAAQVEVAAAMSEVTELAQQIQDVREGKSRYA